MSERLTLKELMRLSYNAGGEAYTDGKPVAARNFDWWWEEEGRERYEDYQMESGPSESDEVDPVAEFTEAAIKDFQKKSEKDSAAE